MDRPDQPDASALLNARPGQQPTMPLTDRTARVRLSVEQYRDELLGQLADRDLRSEGHRAQDETMAVVAADGRVLAADVRADIDVPAFDNSGMDGYAVRWADIAGPMPCTLEVVADIAAGAADNPPLTAGQCARIMTGAAIPDDADTVVQVELTDDGHDTVTVHRAPEPGQGAFIRRHGSATSAGQVVADAGTRVDAGVIAALLSAGIAEVHVRARPRVAIASTGDELVAPGTPLQRGQIHDVNTAYLASRAASYGARVTALDPLPDDEDTFTARLDAACADHDLVVLTGGASVGDHDVARIVLGAREPSAFRHVAMQPGKPQGWARWGRALVVSLPGNPLSAAVSFRLFVVPLIERLAGVDRTGSPSCAQPEPSVRAIAAASWTPPADRRQYVPARLSYDARGQALVTPVHRHGSASHLTTTLSDADVLAVVPEDATEVTQGDVLDIVRMR